MSDKVLIIAKTYPELSSKYGETVCTAAISEGGRPLRLYPIPFRYLSGPERFQRYQWINAELTKSSNDIRPESHIVSEGSISLAELVPATNDEWGKRELIVLRDSTWQFSSMRALLEAQRSRGCSLAFIRPREIVSVTIQKRPAVDAANFEEKMRRLRKQNAAERSQLVFLERSIPARMKTLEYVGQRICVEWRCSDTDCDKHNMQILDWEICELARRHGLEAARLKVEDLMNLNRYRTAFILGNFHMFQHSFAIIGLWYPLRNDGLLW